MSNEDRFEDIRATREGIFGDDTAALEHGLAVFDSATTVPREDGVHVTMHCRGCSRPVDMTAEWGEIVAIKYNVPPHLAYRGTQGFVQNPVEWRASQQAWWPTIACSSCNTPTAPMFKPEEAEQHLVVGRRNGWVPPTWEQAASQVCARASQAMAQAAQQRR